MKITSQKVNLLPSAIKGTSKDLSKEAKQEISRLCGARPIAFLWQAFSAWFIIFIMIASSIYVNNVLMSIVAVIVIATRINVLALLIHEQAHFLGFRSYYGELIANFFTAFPLATTIENYAQVHLSHHKYYFTEKDPDHLRKSGIDWQFPMSKSHLIKILLSDLVGFSFIKLVKGKQFKNCKAFSRKRPINRLVQVIYYCIVAIILTYMSAWGLFFIYWVLPLITFFPLIVRLGAITEHVYNLPNVSVNNSSPLIILRWWEKLLLPNLNFTYHPYHHFYPGVSFRNLPKVHKVFVRGNLIDNKNIFYGYFSYLQYLQNQFREIPSIEIGYNTYNPSNVDSFNSSMQVEDF